MWAAQLSLRGNFEDRGSPKEFFPNNIDELSLGERFRRVPSTPSPK